MVSPSKRESTKSFDLVATIGPSSFSKVAALADAGATRFRLNASHMRPEELAAAVSTMREEAPGMPLVIDLQGAKMRLGHFRERTIARDQVLIFTSEPVRRSALPLPHAEIFEAAREGETLTADDGRFRFRIIESTPSALVVTSLDEGILKPRKGVNLLEHPVELKGLTVGDLAHLRSVPDAGRARWAFSFIKDGEESSWLREIVPGCSVAAKIERREAVAAIDQIARRVDEIWICRGDLGEQIGALQLARFVSELDTASLSVPVLMAGQVLEHLTEHPEPTRSEVCHLYDLLRRGYAGIVLSDETAIGRNPERAVKKAHDLIGQFSD